MNTALEAPEGIHVEHEAYVVAPTINTSNWEWIWFFYFKDKISHKI